MSKNFDDIESINFLDETSSAFVTKNSQHQIQLKTNNSSQENFIKSNKKPAFDYTDLNTKNIHKHVKSRKYLKFLNKFQIQNILIIIILILISIILGIKLVNLGQDIKSIKNEVLQVLQSEIQGNRNTTEIQFQNMAQVLQSEIQGIKNMTNPIEKILENQGNLTETAQNKDLMDYVDLGALYKSHEFIDCMNSNNGQQSIHCASKLGRVDCVMKLIKNGIPVDKKDDGDRTPLHYASEFGHLNVVQFLVDINAPIDDQTKNGNTGLIISAWFEHKSIVEYLCSKNANVHIKNKMNETALDKAISNKYHEIVDILKKYGA